MKSEQWILNVTERDQHAYNRLFRTKRQAVEALHKVLDQGSRWGGTVKKMEKPTVIKVTADEDSDPFIDSLPI